MRVFRACLLGVMVFVLVSTVSISNLSVRSDSDSLSWIQFGDGRARTSSLVEDKVLTIAMGHDIATMDPAKTAAMYGPAGMIYETLIAVDKAGEYVPGFVL